MKNNASPHLSCAFKTCAILLAILLLIPGPYAAKTTNNLPLAEPPQGELTVLAIRAAVGDVLRKLNDLVVSIGGQVNISIGVASEELTNKLNQLNDIARDQINVPLRNLSLAAQDIGRQIMSSVDRLNFILNSQRECVFQNAQVLLSSIQNIGESLKRGFPLVKASSQVSHFQFDNAPVFAVPLRGGRMTVFGSGLWTQMNLPPIVELQTRDGQTTFQTLTPQRANNNDSFTVAVDGSTLQSHIGDCLQLRVQERHREGFIIRRTRTTEFAIPLCVPQRFNTEFVVEAEASYNTRRTVTTNLPAQVTSQTNDSCENGITVHTELHFNLPSGQGISGARISTIDQRPGNNTFNQQNVVCTRSGTNTVVCNGSLDSATCICVPIAGCRRTHSSVFERVITPTIEFLREERLDLSGTSERVPMGAPNTQIQVLIPVQIPPDRTRLDTTFSFRVIRFINGQRTEVLFESPRTTVNNDGGSSPTGQAGNFQINGVFNPTPINGHAQLTVTIHGPACGS